MVRTAVRRISWGLTDQAATSLTTLCVSIAALHGATDGAAEFAVAFIGFTLGVGFSRSITTEPLAPDLALAADDRVRAHVRASGVVGLLVGLLTAALCLPLVHPHTALGAWGLAFPVVMVPVDSIRAAWVGGRRPQRAARLSGVQLAAAVVGAVLAALGTAVWALVPLVVVSALLAAGSVAAPAPPLRLAQLRPQHWVYAGEWSLTFGLAQSSSLVLAALGLTLLPLLLRAQGVVFGPLSSLTQAVAALSVPEFVSLRRRSPNLLVGASVLSGALVAGCAAYAAVLLLLPRAWLAAVLGTAWPSFQPVLVAAAIATVVAGAAMGPLVAMRAHGAARTSLSCRVVMGTASLALPVPAALVWGPAGFFLGSAAASVIGGVWSLAALARIERRGIGQVPAVLQPGAPA